jgi:hypothetical protein
MADAEHSKCFARKGVGVQVPPPAQTVKRFPAPGTTSAHHELRMPGAGFGRGQTHSAPRRTDRADSQVVEIVLVQIASVEIVVLVEVVVLLEI